MDENEEKETDDTDDVDMNEIFEIQKCDEPNEFAIVNTRIDYQCRGDDLAHLNLYEYVSSIYKKRINSKEMNDILNIDRQKRVSVHLTSLVFF